MNVTLQSKLLPADLIVRPDRGRFIVEDPQTGEFYEMPEVCVKALEALREGKTLGAVEAELSARYPDEEVDMMTFAGQLLELGLVSEVDGIPADRRAKGNFPARRNTEFQWISPKFAAGLFHPFAWTGYALIAAANIVLLAVRPDLFPRFRDAFVFDSMVLNSLTWMGVSLALVLLHEFGHIAAVRSFGLPARLGIGHRYFLVVFETDMSGIWRLPSRKRHIAFLAGICFDQTVLLACLSAQLWLPDGSTFAKMAAYAALDLFLKLAYQCCFFMKTDLYYVVENGTGCYNLMERSRDWLLRKLGFDRPDPGASNPRERRAIRGYAYVYAAGFAVSLLLFAAYLVPQLVVSLATVLPRLAEPADRMQFWDAVVFVGQLVVMGSLLLYSWGKKWVLSRT